LVNATGASYWKGLLLAEDQLRQNATAHGMSVAQWRSGLQSRYRAILKELQQANGASGPPGAAD
jgi:hypothetical protein